jgi:D-amino-acid dehydrogenase
MLAPLHPEPPRDLWTGMRPIAPDGLPIVDRAPGLSNTYLATAYSMLGMTVAAPAAEALTELVLTGRRRTCSEPFAATRCSGACPLPRLARYMAHFVSPRLDRPRSARGGAAALVAAAVPPPRPRAWREVLAPPAVALITLVVALIATDAADIRFR